jgi:sulfur carrier protein ThiS
MARLVFTANLLPYTRGLREIEVRGARVSDLLGNLDAALPGIRHYLVDDQGSLRRHVNVFVDGRPVADRARLADRIEERSVVHLLQALSGG